MSESVERLRRLLEAVSDTPELEDGDREELARSAVLETIAEGEMLVPLPQTHTATGIPLGSLLDTFAGAVLERAMTLYMNDHDTEAVVAVLQEDPEGDAANGVVKASSCRGTRGGDVIVTLVLGTKGSPRCEPYET